MSDRGWGGKRGRQNGGEQSGQMSRGIQFVKSSEVLNPNPKSEPRNGNSAGGHQAGQRDIPSLWGSPATVSSPSSGLSRTDSLQPHVPTGTSNNVPFQFGQSFVRFGDNSSGTNSSGRNFTRGPDLRSIDHKTSSTISLGKSAAKPPVPVNTFSQVPEAKPLLSKEEYLKLWKAEKDEVLEKFRKLTYEVVSLKTARPNAKDKLHSAANRVPIRIEFNTEPVFGAKNTNSFLCHVFIEGIAAATGQGVKIKDSKTNAYESALQKILMPYLRIVQLDPERKVLQASKEPFTGPPPEPSKVPLPKVSSAAEVASQHKESNMEAACLKRRFNEYKPLEEFVIVEPKTPIPDCTPAHTLRRSADFNHMLLEYEYFFKGEAARCVLKIENQVLADVNGVSKVAAKNNAATQALKKLKTICWVIKTKKAFDSDTKISKEEMLNELNEQSDEIGNDNIGNKLLRKMGWSGGGVGKDGSGIAEPVSLKSVLNREGFGLGTHKGITDEFRRRVRDVIEKYAASDNNEDLVFSCDFRLDERQIIHDECRRLHLRSKSRGKGNSRYLCVRRKRSANQLFDHIMSCGGETTRYQLVPPGFDCDDASSQMTKSWSMPGMGGTFGKNSGIGGCASAVQAFSNSGQQQDGGHMSQIGSGNVHSGNEFRAQSAGNSRVAQARGGVQSFGMGDSQNMGMQNIVNSQGMRNGFNSSVPSQAAWADPSYAQGTCNQWNMARQQNNNGNFDGMQMPQNVRGMGNQGGVVMPQNVGKFHNMGTGASNIGGFQGMTDRNRFDFQGMNNQMMANFQGMAGNFQGIGNFQRMPNQMGSQNYMRNTMQGTGQPMGMENGAMGKPRMMNNYR